MEELEKKKKPTRSRRKRRTLFDEETELFKEEKARLNSDDLTNEELKKSALKLLDAYKDLIDSSKLSTKVNDKLMFGLNENYAELMEEKRELEERIKSHNRSFFGNFIKIDY